MKLGGSGAQGHRQGAGTAASPSSLARSREPVGRPGSWNNVRASVFPVGVALQNIGTDGCIIIYLKFKYIYIQKIKQSPLLAASAKFQSFAKHN